MYYSEALDYTKDIKSIWTNRALAYTKMRHFKKAISDCSRILEFCEVLEEGYEKSKDMCFKVKIVLFYLFIY